jgi:hypothetical protein
VIGGLLCCARRLYLDADVSALNGGREINIVLSLRQ